MLESGQSWINVGVSIVIATLGGAGFYWATRSGRSPTPYAQVAFALIVCVFMLGLGFVLQPLLWETLIARPSGPGTLYAIEYHPGAAATGIFRLWLSSGLIPGVALGMMLTRSRSAATLVGACVSTILILSGYDLLLLVPTSWHLLLNPTRLDRDKFDALVSQTGYSLICDVVGGFVGGAVCWFSLRWLIANLCQDDMGKRLRATWHIMVGVFLSLAFGFGGYLVFLHPIPETVRLSVGAYRSRSITFAQSSAAVKGLFSPTRESQLQKEISNVAISLPLSQVHIRTLGLGAALETRLGTYSTSKPNLVYSLSFNGDGHGAPIRAEVVGGVGCNNGEAAIQISHQHGLPNKLVDLNGLMATMQGVTQELDGFAPDDQSVTAKLYIPRGQGIRQFSEPPNGPSLAPLIGYLEIPATPGAAIVLSAIPDLMTGFLAGADAARSADRTPSVGLTLVGKDGTQTMFVPHSVHDESTCHVTQLRSSAFENDTLPPGETWKKGNLIITIKAADPNAVLRLTVNLFTEMHFESLKYGPAVSGHDLDFFDVTPVSGEMIVGERQLALHSGDEVALAARSTSFQDAPDGSFALEGTSRYVLLNGQLLTASLWTSLDPGFRHSIELALLAAAGWVLKHHWDELLAKMKAIL